MKKQKLQFALQVSMIHIKNQKVIIKANREILIYLFTSTNFFTYIEYIL